MTEKLEENEKDPLVKENFEIVKRQRAELQ